MLFNVIIGDFSRAWDTFSNIMSLVAYMPADRQSEVCRQVWIGGSGDDPEWYTHFYPVKSNGCKNSSIWLQLTTAEWGKVHRFSWSSVYVFKAQIYLHGFHLIYA